MRGRWLCSLAPLLIVFCGVCLVHAHACRWVGYDSASRLEVLSSAVRTVICLPRVARQSDQVQGEEERQKRIGHVIEEKTPGLMVLSSRLGLDNPH